MATTVGLIRHGVTEWNKRGKAQGISDIPLNEEGISKLLHWLIGFPRKNGTLLSPVI